MIPKFIICLALVLSGGLFGRFATAQQSEPANNSGFRWGEVVAGFQMGTMLDESNGIVHCRIRNATTNEMDYPSFDFGYFDFIRLELPIEPVNVSDIRITFAKPPTVPAGELSEEAMYPPGFDPTERGAFTNIVAGHITALNVTWANPNHFKTEEQTRDFLRELLSNTNTETWTFHIWSNLDGEPSVVANIEHTTGKPGQWMIWCSPNLAWAYQDKNGKWWWGLWQSWRLGKPKSLENQ